MSIGEKHTKGPWELCRSCNEDFEAHIDLDNADIYIMGEGEELKANANLIAAAPCLLEALEYECGQCKDDDSNFRTNCRGCKTRKAIAKAHGETK